MKYSVIDISSSSISMIVAAADADKTEVVFKERASLSLVHYLEEGALSARGTEKLTEMLLRFKETGAELGVERCYLIATAALRHVKNYDEIAAQVLAQTGLPVNLIDGATEAYCDYVANLYYKSFERPVLIDLGGKSIEICDLAKNSKEEMMCFSFGLLDLYRKFVSNIYPDEKEAKDIRRFVKEKFNDADLPEEGVYSTAVLVGATGNAMYDIYADFADDSSATGARVIRRKKFKKLVKHLLTGEDRSRLVLNNAPEKLYLIGSAAIVLKLLFKRFGVENVLVSERGVKEGYLQLVLEGREEGAFYAFPKAEEKEAPAKPAAKRGRPKKAEGTKETPAKPAAKRGRPKKAEGTKEMPAKPAAKRGRPKKAAPAAATVTEAPAAETLAPEGAEGKE